MKKNRNHCKIKTIGSVSKALLTHIDSCANVPMSADQVPDEMEGLASLVERELRGVPHNHQMKSSLILTLSLSYKSRLLLRRLAESQGDDQSQDQYRRHMSKVVYGALVEWIEGLESTLAA